MGHHNAVTNNEPKPIGVGFRLAWVLISAVSAPLAAIATFPLLALAWANLRTLEKFPLLVKAVWPSTYPDTGEEAGWGILGAALLWALFGSVVGLAQSLVLRRRVRRPTRWALVPMLLFGTAGAIVAAISPDGAPNPGPAQMVFLGIPLTVLLGIPVFWVLRRRLTRG